MDYDVVLAKLESLERCVRRVEEKTPHDVEALEADFDVQDILILNLERAVQLCVDVGLHILADTSVPVPTTMGAVFRVLAEKQLIPLEVAERLGQAVGLRNIAVHQYKDIDWAVVYTVTHKHLDDFRVFAAAVAAQIHPGC